MIGSYSYDPYGKPRNTTGTATNPFRYTGAYTDSTGLVKLGARYYDPTTGRFTQQDPSGQETNAYNYVNCNPINATDPTGLNGVGCAAALFGFASVALGFLAVVSAPATAGLIVVAFSLAVGGSSLGLIGAGLGTANVCN